MTEFTVTQIAFGDIAGRGLWEIGHYRQHLNYLNRLASLNPPVIIAIAPIMAMGRTRSERRFWLDAHARAHDAIRPYANVTGIDLAEVDFDDKVQWYDWMDAHASEHELLDTGLGV